MKLEELNAEEQDDLFHELVGITIDTVKAELEKKGITDYVDQSVSLMNVCCGILATQIDMMPKDKHKYALDKLVYGIIESLIPTLNDEYLNGKDSRD